MAAPRPHRRTRKQTQSRVLGPECHAPRYPSFCGKQKCKKTRKRDLVAAVVILDLNTHFPRNHSLCKVQRGGRAGGGAPPHFVLVGFRGSLSQDALRRTAPFPVRYGALFARAAGLCMFVVSTMSSCAPMALSNLHLSGFTLLCCSSSFMARCLVVKMQIGSAIRNCGSRIATTARQVCA